MQAVNKKMDPQKTLKTMQDFQKENMKMGMTEDMSKYMQCTQKVWYLQAFQNQVVRIYMNDVRSDMC